MSDLGTPGILTKAYRWLSNQFEGTANAQTFPGGTSQQPPSNAGGSPPQPDQVPDEIIVKFKPHVAVDQHQKKANVHSVSNLFQRHGVYQTEKVFKGHPKLLPNDSRRRMGPLPDLSNIHRLKVPQGRDIRSIIDEFKRDPNVEYAEPNFIYRPCETIPNDPYFVQQWALTKIQAPQAWDIERGSPNVVIAVVDTGIDFNHPDLAGKLWTNEDETGSNGIDDDNNGFVDDHLGWNFSQNNNNPMDDDSHGTKVAGLIAAITNNNLGVSGLNWNSKIMAVKGSDFPSVKYAADNGAHIITMSWGGYGYSQLGVDTLNYAFNKGCILFGGAGNDGRTDPFHPASYPNVISVGATDLYDHRADWGLGASSNYGSWVDLFAPGKEEYTTCLNNSYCLMGGTSAASPFAAGLAALILSADPFLSNKDVFTIMKRSADDLGTPGWDYNFAWGRINAYKALSQMNSAAYPEARIFSPLPNTVFNSGTIDIIGKAQDNVFDHYILEWGLGDNPTVWNANNIILENGGLTPVDNGKLGSIYFDLYGKITIRLKVSTQDTNYSTSTTSIRIDNTLKTGWPQTIDSPSIYSSRTPAPCLADLDGDGTDEIIIGSIGGKIHVMSGDGTNLPGWPISIGSSIWSTPAAADLDADGKKEVIVGSGDGKVHIFKLDGSPFPNWPKLTQGSIYSSPSIADINNDGYLDIIVPSYDGNVYVWDKDGNLLNGWPQAPEKSWIESTAAIGRFDQGDQYSVVFGGNWDNKAYLWDRNGTLANGWPIISGGNSHSSPALGDLNNNGQLNIIIGSWTGNTFNWDKGGTLVNGWPVEGRLLPNSSPALGKITNANSLNIVMGGTNNKVYLYDKNGISASGWPLITTDGGYSAAVLGDLDNDGVAEVIIGGDGGALYAWNRSGYSVANFHKITGGRILSSPAIGEVDGDGFVDVVVFSTDGKLYTWGTSGLYDQNKMEWPQFMHDARHTGNYHTDVIPPNISHNSVSTAACNSDIIIPSVVTDNDSVSGAKLYFKNDPSATYQFIQMSNLGGNAWQGTIPASYAIPGTIQYYIVAHDNSLNPKISPLGAPEKAINNIFIIDNIPPVIIHNPITTASIDTDIPILAQASDNVSVQGLKLYYRNPNNPTWQILLMNQSGGNYTATIASSGVTLDGLQYYLKALDTSNNIATAPVGVPINAYNVTVTDNDPPSIIHTPLNRAEEGQDLIFIAQAEDNSGNIPLVDLFFKRPDWQDWRSFPMANNGSSFSVTVPGSYVSPSNVGAATVYTLSYFISASDNSGNLSRLPLAAPPDSYTIYVSEKQKPNDTNPPTITHQPISEAPSNMALLITADITDDISGVGPVKLYYRHKDKYDWKNIDFELKGGDFYSAYVPNQDMLEGNMEYYIEAKDKNGNTAKSDAYAVRVIRYMPSAGCGCAIGR